MSQAQSLSEIFSLAGSQVDKGIFEIRLEKEAKGAWIRVIHSLGPVRGRLLALALFLLASYGNYFRLRYTQAYTPMFYATGALCWAGMLSGLAIYFTIFATRTEKLFIRFNKVKNVFDWEHIPFWTKMKAHRGEISFSNFNEIVVFGPHKEPTTPHGYIVLKTKYPPDVPGHCFKFKLLSEDQLKIYPLNLSKILNIDPKGDWVEP